jgi:hypothetical protein
MIPAVLTVAHGGRSMFSNSPTKTLVSVGLQPSNVVNKPPEYRTPTRPFAGT